MWPRDAFREAKMPGFSPGYGFDWKCARLARDVRDLSCLCGTQGDSGGPFVCKDDHDQWTQIGAVSFGDQYCTQGVVARIPSYVDWIHEIIASEWSADMGVVARGWTVGGNCPTPKLNFSLSENFVFVGKLSSKNTQFRTKNEIVITHNALLEVFRCLSENCNFLPALINFLSHDVAVRRSTMCCENRSSHLFTSSRRTLLLFHVVTII